MIFYITFFLVSLLYLLLSDKRDVVVDLLAISFCLYNVLLCFQNYLSIYEFVLLYTQVSSGCTLLLILLLIKKDLLLFSLTTFPFKILELVFLTTPEKLPYWIYPHILYMESWFSYGVVGIVLAFNYDKEYVTTRQIILNSSVTFLLAIPYINNFI